LYAKAPGARGGGIRRIRAEGVGGPSSHCRIVASAGDLAGGMQPITVDIVDRDGLSVRAQGGDGGVAQPDGFFCQVARAVVLAEEMAGQVVGVEDRAVDLPRWIQGVDGIICISGITVFAVATIVRPCGKAISWVTYSPSTRNSWANTSPSPWTNSMLRSKLYDLIASYLKVSFLSCQGPKNSKNNSLSRYANRAVINHAS
jgi:hypothetical protein